MAILISFSFSVSAKRKLDFINFHFVFSILILFPAFPFWFPTFPPAYQTITLWFPTFPPWFPVLAPWFPAFPPLLPAFRPLSPYSPHSLTDFRHSYPDSSHSHPCYLHFTIPRISLIPFSNFLFRLLQIVLETCQETLRNSIRRKFTL